MSPARLEESIQSPVLRRRHEGHWGVAESSERWAAEHPLSAELDRPKREFRRRCYRLRAAAQAALPLNTDGVWTRAGSQPEDGEAYEAQYDSDGVDLLVRLGSGLSNEPARYSDSSAGSRASHQRQLTFRRHI